MKRVLEAEQGCYVISVILLDYGVSLKKPLQQRFDRYFERNEDNVETMERFERLEKNIKLYIKLNSTLKYSNYKAKIRKALIKGIIEGSNEFIEVLNKDIIEPECYGVTLQKLIIRVRRLARKEINETDSDMLLMHLTKDKQGIEEYTKIMGKVIKKEAVIPEFDVYKE